MQFKFDANQEFQLAAVGAVADLLDGQPKINGELHFALGHSAFAAVANRLELDERALLTNLQAVQQRNGIKELDTELKCLTADIETGDGMKQARFPNFSVEMETGTGKTYVYIRTALELHRRYGLRKYIVVVPSIAIKEGVLKALQVTHTHLRELYDNAPYRYYVYDSASLSQVRQFAMSDGVEIMVMTIDSFNKASNVIRQSTDRLQGETPVHLVQASRPILILDEPQNMESEQSVQALSALDPLFALRYSATHRNPYNLIYRLTPFEAYRQRLVKRIEVAGVEKENDANQVYLRLDGITTERTHFKARVAVHKLMADGTVKEKLITLKPGDSLEEKTGRAEYRGYDVDEIDRGAGLVRFTNDVEIRLGEALGADKEAIFESQIRYAVAEHFRKQQKLKPYGIKVLSLFFIDRVSNYDAPDAIIRRLFNRAFDELKPKYPEWKDQEAEKVQAAYFAQKRRRGGSVELLDTVSGKAKEDEAAYDLIMKDKERLLSFDEPVAFIFSHSALREGWDNPNVFQICTLNQTVSEVKKRQEVGRGVRLAVDQTGSRIRDERVNVLTVVANESYEQYVQLLQSEIEDEYGKEGAPPKPTNARQRATAKLRKEYTLLPEFKELWERIKQKTRYAVKIDTDLLLRDVVEQLEKEEISLPRVTVKKAKVEVGAEDEYTPIQATRAIPVLNLAGRYPLPNLVELMAELMERTSPPVRLTRSTLLEVFKRCKNKQAGTDNPQAFATAAVRIIKDNLADQLVNGIQYERIDDWYEMTQLETEIETWMDYLVKAGSASLYDYVPYESETERAFVKAMDGRSDVKLYFKLPRWLTVPTPVGEYNPDWAIVMEDRDQYGEPTGENLLYLVRETKGSNWKTDLRPDERRKIRCGDRHFNGALGTSYRVITDAGELPGGELP
jgi:type III restriction enzyme